MVPGGRPCEWIYPSITQADQHKTRPKKRNYESAIFSDTGKHVTTVDLNALETSQIAALTTAQVVSLTTSQIAGLTTADLNALSTAQFAALIVRSPHAGTSNTRIKALWIPG